MRWLTLSGGETATPTGHVQLLQVDASGDDFKERDVGDVSTAMDVETAQFRTSPRHRVESLVREVDGATQAYRLDHHTHGRRVEAEAAGQSLQRLVDVNLRVGGAIYAYAAPQCGVPRAVSTIGGRLGHTGTAGRC